MLNFVIGKGLVGAGPSGGTGQEGLHASAGTGRVVGDLGLRVGALEAGDPSFNSGLLRGGAGAEKLPEIGVDLEVESEEELLSVVVAVLSPQAATEASITMPDRAAMERTRMFFCMIIT